MTNTPGGSPLGAGSASSSSQPQQAVEKTKQAAGKLGDKATEALRTQTDERSTKAGESVESVAKAFRSTGDKLRMEGAPGPVATAVDTIADKAEQLGAYLRENDSETLLHDLERFGRNKPWAIAAAAAGVGFVASRLLKASSTTRYERTQLGTGYGTGYGTTAAGYPRTATGSTYADRELELPPVPAARPTAGAGNGYSTKR